MESDPLMIETTANLRRVREAYVDRIAAIDSVLASMGEMSPASAREMSQTRGRATASDVPRKRRQMSQAARDRVAKRMKAYWKNRRKAGKVSPASE